MVSLYRASNSDDKVFSLNFGKLTNLLCSDKNCEFIIGTDHNYDLLKGHLHSMTQKFIDLLLDNNVWPVITKPTQITKSSATLIDNLIVSPNIYGAYESGIFLEDRSDHLPCVMVAQNFKNQ